MQKFFRGQRVRLKMADEYDDEAIVDHSYSDQYGRLGEDDRYDHQMSLLRLRNGKPVNRISWYSGSNLELLSDDRHAGERLLQLFKEPH
jgi:hypothetical protein